MYKKLLFNLLVLMMVLGAVSAFAEVDKFGQDSQYMELNGTIPKEYGRLVQVVDDKYMFFEANDGTIRIVGFQIYDDTNHYISKLQNNVIKRK